MRILDVAPLYNCDIACNCYPGVELYSCIFIIKRRTLLPQIPPNFLPRNPIIWLLWVNKHFCISRCFSTTCLAANIASVVPLLGMKPNCSSPVACLLPQPSVNYSFPNLHRNIYHLEASIIPTIRDVPFLFDDWYYHTVPPFLRHLLLLEHRL